MGRREEHREESAAELFAAHEFGGIAVVSIEATHQPGDEPQTGKGTIIRVALRLSSLHESAATVVRSREAQVRRGGGKVAPPTYVPIRNQARG